MIYLIIPALIPLLAAGLTAAGSIGGAALSRGGSRRAIDRQNEYNSPKNQVQRLREAGLPYAALTNSISGNQSQTQAYTESGFGEAIGGGIDKFIQTTQQKKAIEAIDAQINATNAQAEATHSQREKTNAERDTILYDLQMKQRDPTMDGTSYVERTQSLEIEYRQLQNEMSRMGNDFKLIENIVQRDLYYDGTLTNTARQQLKNLMMQSDTMQQHIRLVATQIKSNDIQNELNEGLLREGVLSSKAKAELQNLLTQNIHGAQDLVRQSIEIDRLSNTTRYEIAQQKVLMKLIEGLEKKGLSVSDAFFHTLMTRGFGLPNLNQFKE